MSDLTVGDLTLAPGERGQGAIEGVELNTTDRVDVPVLGVNGAREGPTVLVFAVQHGNELQGAGVVHRVMGDVLDPETTAGAVIGIPVGNPLSYVHHGRPSWPDGADVGFVSTDTPGGGPTERLANALWEEAWSRADVVANLHAGVHPDALPYQWIWGGSPVADTLHGVAQAIGLTTVVYEREAAPNLPPILGEDLPPTLRNRAHSQGIAEVTVELRKGRWITDPETSVGTRAVANLLKHRNVLDGDPVPQECRVVESRHTGGDGVHRFYGTVRADRGGILYPTCEPGEFVDAGGTVAEVTDLHGNTVESVETPVDGYVWLYPGGEVLGTPGYGQTVHAGGTVAYVFTREEA
jgi:hypothetical protein